MDGEVATTAGAESSAPVESDGGIQQDEDTNEPTKTMPEEEASQLPPSSGMASWLLMLALFPAIIGYALHNGFAPRNMDQLKALLGRATTEWSGRLLNSTESSRAAEADVKDEAADVVDVEPLSAPAKRGGRKTPAKSSTERAAASATTAPKTTPHKATLSKRGTLRTAEDDGDSTTHAGTETAYKISAGADGQVNVTPVRRTRRGSRWAPPNPSCSSPPTMPSPSCDKVANSCFAISDVKAVPGQGQCGIFSPEARCRKGDLVSSLFVFV